MQFELAEIITIGPNLAFVVIDGACLWFIMVAGLQILADILIIRNISII